MGASTLVSARVVFDTSTVISALLFKGGRLEWLRRYWQQGDCVPLISSATAAELTRVLAYPKFRLELEVRRELLGDYLPWCDVVEVRSSCPQVCRDSQDQPFLDLAHYGEAQVLVSSDLDLLALAGRTRFAIETAEAYRRRVEQAREPR
ncbi:MAG: putative toxin-antitoxin system toxin component, PIN family [Acidobacteriaceae bacterium]